METVDNKRDAYTILESDDFDTLLDAVELMAKAQGDLLALQNSVEDLKEMMENTDFANDDLTIKENALIYDTIDRVESLVENIANDDYIKL